MIHVHQFEVMQQLGLTITVINVYSGFDFASEWYELLVLPAASGIAYLASMLQAIIRGETPYKNNIFEESAYAQE